MVKMSVIKKKLLKIRAGRMWKIGDPCAIVDGNVK